MRSRRKMEKFEKYSEDKQGQGAPFNLALATLEKLSNMTKSYYAVSTGFSIDNENIPAMTKGQAQHQQYRILRQIFIQSVPLFDPKKHQIWKNETKKKIFSMSNKLKVGSKVDTIRNKTTGYYEAFNPELENELDEIFLEILEKLQEKGYFMPSKSDPRYGWKQSE